MPKLKQVCEFDQKEVHEILMSAARERVGKVAVSGSASHIEVFGKLKPATSEDKTSSMYIDSVVVSFNGSAQGGR